MAKEEFTPVSINAIVTLFGIIGTLASLIGIPLTIVLARRSERQKRLIYDTTPPLPLANVLPNRTEHRLSIVYVREGEEPINVQGAYLRFVRIGNLGKEPVKREDCAPSDPPRLEIRGAKVLDIAVADLSRDVIKFELGPVEEGDESITISPVIFDFLDFRDVALIRVLTDRPTARIRLLGTVIGMPQGIRSFRDLERSPVRGIVGGSLSALLYVAAFAGSLYLFRLATGNWTLWWVLLLPIAALILPGILIAVVASTIWPRGSQWPNAPAPPTWFGPGFGDPVDPVTYQEVQMLSERMRWEAAREELERTRRGEKI